MKVLLMLSLALGLSNAAVAAELEENTKGLCIMFEKTTSSEGAVDFRTYHPGNIKYKKCNSKGVQTARKGDGLVEVFVRFDDPATAQSLTFRKYTGSEIGGKRVVLAGDITAEEYRQALRSWIESIELP